MALSWPAAHCSGRRPRQSDWVQRLAQACGPTLRPMCSADAKPATATERYIRTSTGARCMKLLTLSTILALGLAAGAAGPAAAKGCVKGAVVGGVGGHLAHHGVLGAAGGCAVGHHMAAEKDKQAERQQLQNR